MEVHEVTPYVWEKSDFLRFAKFEWKEQINLKLELEMKLFLGITFVFYIWLKRGSNTSSIDGYLWSGKKVFLTHPLLIVWIRSGHNPLFESSEA